MSLQGSLVVVAAEQDPGLNAALASAGAFPIVETSCVGAVAAITAAKPAAILLADAAAAIDGKLAESLARDFTSIVPIIPVLARLSADSGPAHREALPFAANASPAAIAARLTAALRVRALHAAVLRRAEAAKANGHSLPEPRNNDPLEDATVIVSGRGRSYPALAVGVGECAALIGALSIETAARYLKSRAIDGLIIGDGFSLSTLRAVLTIIAEDAHFRDLPVALLNNLGVAFEHDLPSLIQESDTGRLLAHVLPYIRLHAFEARLRRMLVSLDHDGLIDPDTGLLRSDAFARELERAIRDAKARSTGLSLARLVFEAGLNEKASLDAARLVSGLIRAADFGCREDDGSILVAFTETDLRHAHVVARRVASVLRRTMVNIDHQSEPTAPAVTLASLKSSDGRDSLMARVSVPAIAAE